MKISLYNALVKPHYDYGSAIWANAISAKLKQKLVVAQKRILRSIYLKTFDAHSEPLFERSNILKFGKLIQLNVQVLGHSLWYNDAPVALTMATSRSTTIQNTRAKNNFDIPNLKNMKLRSLPAYNCLISWNALSNEIKSIALPKAFKLAIKFAY